MEDLLIIAELARGTGGAGISQISAMVGFELHPLD